MAVPRLVFVTERGERHQTDALSVAPDGIDITMLRSPDANELQEALATARYLISERRGLIDADLMDGAHNLKLVLRLGAVTHDIDLDAARARGIIVCQHRQGAAMRAAEHVFLQVLALVWRLNDNQAIARAAGDGWAERRRTDEDHFAFNWSKRRNLPGLGGMTVGILGFGEIGSELARRFAGWDCRLTYACRRRLPADVERDQGLARLDNDDLIASCDVLINLLPYTSETVGYLDRRRLSSMRSGAFLVSTGSGGVLDEQALADLVRDGHVAGAAVDTFAVEPVEADNPLVELARTDDRVVLTPHVASGAASDVWGEFATMYDSISQHMVGRDPVGRIA